MYYMDRVLPRVQEEMQSLGELDQRKRISLIQHIMRQQFEHESKEIKAEVEAKLEESRTTSEDSDGDGMTSLNYQHAIDQIPSYLGRVLSELSEQSGWSFSILMGGPSPKSNGDIVVARFMREMTYFEASLICQSVCMRALSFDFSQAYPDFHKHCLVPYTQFLENAYPERVRRTRALNLNMTSNELTSPEPTASEAVHVNWPSTDLAQTLTNHCDAPVSANSGDNLPGIPSPPIHRNASFDVPHIPSLAGCNVSLNSNIAQPLPKEYDPSKPPYIDSNALPEESTAGFVSSSLDPAQPSASPDAGGGSQLFFNPLSQGSVGNSFQFPVSSNQFAQNGFESFLGGSNVSFAADPNFAMNLDFDYSGMAQNWTNDGNMLAWPVNGLGQGAAPSVSTFGNTFQFPPTILPGRGQGTSPIFEVLDPSVSTFGNTFQFPPAIGTTTGVHVSTNVSPAAGTTAIDTPFQFPPAISTTTGAHVSTNVSPAAGTTAIDTPFQFPPAISTTTGAHVSTNVSPAAGTTAVGTPYIQFPSTIGTTSGAHVSTNVSPTAVTTAVDTPFNTSQSPHGDKTGAGDLDRNSTSTLPDPEIQREKPKKGRSKASCAMQDYSNSLIAELEGVLPNNNSSDKLNVPGSEARRSARTIVPSKRCEQMNQIRLKNAAVTSASVDKENIPLNSRPNWAIATQDHLLGMELGGEWRACVHHWVELEEILGYGMVAGTRAALPTAVLRPEEWSRWVAKTRGGKRAYGNLPFIMDSADLGIAIVKWWNAMQPEFRQSPQGMPQPLYTLPDDAKHAWAPLQCAGPNGLVTVMTLLFWWGSSLKARTRWQDDSSSSWEEAVEDVAQTLQALKHASALCSKKRKVANTTKGNSGKR